MNELTFTNSDKWPYKDSNIAIIGTNCKINKSCTCIQWINQGATKTTTTTSMVDNVAYNILNFIGNCGRN